MNCEISCLSSNPVLPLWDISLISCPFALSLYLFTVPWYIGKSKPVSLDTHVPCHVPSCSIMFFHVLSCSFMFHAVPCCSIMFHAIWSMTPMFHAICSFNLDVMSHCPILVCSTHKYLSCFPMMSVLVLSVCPHICKNPFYNWLCIVVHDVEHGCQENENPIGDTGLDFTCTKEL